MLRQSLWMVFFLSACQANNFPKYSTLEKLRVLALVVDTPEIQSPGAGTTNVSLTPYLSDIGGSGNVDLTVQSCLDPGVAAGSEPSCSGALYASPPQTVSVTAPAGQAAGIFGSPERTGAPSSGGITVGLQIPANLLLAFPTVLQHNGVPYLITVTAQRGSQTVRSFRRVLISTKSANLNPTLTDILVNGSSLTTLPTGEPLLSFSASTPETYQSMASSGALVSETEAFVLTWFISDGEMENSRILEGQNTIWKTPGGAPSQRQVVVVGVLRDGRGGVAVLVKKL